MDTGRIATTADFRRNFSAFSLQPRGTARGGIALALQGVACGPSDALNP